MTTSSPEATTEQAAERPQASERTAQPPVAEFDELAAQATSGDEVELDVILDVPVTLALEVGRTNITIRDLLRLNQGSVVELDRPADEPMDVLVNGTLVAHAEIVVVDDMFGIRLLDVVSPSERIRKLK
jgi:flagellar motor switch protein FliN/FliY